jgi:hypothetical protein
LTFRNRDHLAYTGSLLINGSTFNVVGGIVALSLAGTEFDFQAISSGQAAAINRDRRGRAWSADRCRPSWLGAGFRRRPFDVVATSDGSSAGLEIPRRRLPSIVARPEQCLASSPTQKRRLFHQHETLELSAVGRRVVLPGLNAKNTAELSRFAVDGFVIQRVQPSCRIGTCCRVEF